MSRFRCMMKQLTLVLLMTIVCIEHSACDLACPNYDLEGDHKPQQEASALDLKELRDLLAAAEKASFDLNNGIERARRRLGAEIVSQPEGHTSLALAHGARDLSFTGAIDFRNGMPNSIFGTSYLSFVNKTCN